MAGGATAAEAAAVAEAPMPWPEERAEADKAAPAGNMGTVAADKKKGDTVVMTALHHPDAPHRNSRTNYAQDATCAHGND